MKDFLLITISAIGFIYFLSCFRYEKLLQQSHPKKDNIIKMNIYRVIMIIFMALFCFTIYLHYHA